MIHFVWEIDTGVEFQVTPKTTVTPYVQYQDAPDLPGRWLLQLRREGQLLGQPAVGFDRRRGSDDDHNSAFTVGTNFRFAI